MHVVGALQFDVVWENKGANFAKVRELLEVARPVKNSLMALPEMFATGFSMDAERIAEMYGGETEQSLSETAKRFGIFLIGGAAMRGKDGTSRNKALVFSPEGKLIAWYAKMRPFTAGGEKEVYKAGSTTTVFSWGECNVSPFVCYDLRFPELFRDATRKNRPELLVVIANFPKKRIHHWTRLLQARAIENQAYVLGVNRIGNDPYYEYNGGSIVVDPDGDIVASAGEKEGYFSAELDLPKLNKYRTGLPFLNDM